MDSSRQDITFLNFDQTLLEQKTLQKIPHHWLDLSDIPQTNGYCEQSAYDEIERRMKEQKIGPLVFIGNGNYHYVTAILLNQLKEPFSLVLFDHHSDMMDNDVPLLSCGSWVNHVLNTNPFLRKVLIIGVNETDYSSFSANHTTNKVFMIREQKFSETPLSQIIHETRMFLNGEKKIYISIDKDVLYKTESVTNWDQGSMSLVQLLFMLGQLASHFEICGMDVCGEYIGNWANLYDSIEMEHIKMNEIVNWSIIHFAGEIGLIPPVKTLENMVQ